LDRLRPGVEAWANERVSVHPELGFNAALGVIVQLAAESHLIRLADKSKQHGTEAHH
jgi:hypothetical protein